ncbi:RNA polymerase factor sigma-54 [Pseudogemmobacter sonorensis]|uniref:RNA polymerase factor sigma-54 n=1 Tax=Pseudogemmobacter sonorensis TaxID=2989681 RepID=UPI0036A096EE
MNMRVDHRQALQTALSPQMLQSVELLHMTALDLHAFVAAEVEQNPFLESDGPAPTPTAPAAGPPPPGRGAGAGGASDFDRAALVADHLSLHESLEQQFGLLTRDPVLRHIGMHLIRALTPDGYLDDPLDLIALQAGTNPLRASEVLKMVQSLQPSGIGARNLAECLALQLRENNRLDPAMQALLDNLPLMARGDLAALRRLCGVGEDDLREMFAEIRRLDPRPGRAFDSAPLQLVVPDVFVTRAADGGWGIRVNEAALPRVLVNMSYYHELRRDLKSAENRSYLSNRMRAANWLVQGLDQRMRTVLNVATEIVRQQADFFDGGIERLRPLRLRDIADTLGIHESTVSRVTSNKSMATPCGTLPMKFFFPTAIGSAGEGGSHAADTVRHRIREIIKAEPARRPLSDGAIAARLEAMDIRIARRTVTKYREAMNIASSVERARQAARRPAA